MKRTISIKLDTEEEEDRQLFSLEEVYHGACNQIVPLAIEHRCWNRVDLHKLAYTYIRSNSALGSQMVCNAIFAVCKAYKNKNIQKKEEIPKIHFRKYSSIHFDKRTYTIKGEYISLYTLTGRVKVKMILGEFQQKHFSQGIPKEGELIYRKGNWYFNLVLDLPDPLPTENTNNFAIDLGENNLAVTSSGKFFGGGKIRHERDKFLNKRRKLQSNGSQSAKQLLKKISGKEARRMTKINHEVSKQIIKEAQKVKAGCIVLEDLTNIRKRIKGGKRLRSRLHRWSFLELQTFIEYKAQNVGIPTVYINPAYTSQICSICGELGVRKKHHFTCFCGNHQHSDLNASRNHCRFALSIGNATCAVNRTQVAV